MATSTWIGWCCGKKPPNPRSWKTQAGKGFSYYSLLQISACQSLGRIYFCCFKPQVDCGMSQPCQAPHTLHTQEGNPISSLCCHFLSVLNEDIHRSLVILSKWQLVIPGPPAQHHSLPGIQGNVLERQPRLAHWILGNFIDLMMPAGILGTGNKILQATSSLQ